MCELAVIAIYSSQFRSFDAKIYFSHENTGIHTRIQNEMRKFLGDENYITPVQINIYVYIYKSIANIFLFSINFWQPTEINKDIAYRRQRFKVSFVIIQHTKRFQTSGIFYLFVKNKYILPLNDLIDTIFKIISSTFSLFSQIA